MRGVVHNPPPKQIATTIEAELARFLVKFPQFCSPRNFLITTKLPTSATLENGENASRRRIPYATPISASRDTKFA